MSLDSNEGPLKIVGPISNEMWLIRSACSKNSFECPSKNQLEGFNHYKKRLNQWRSAQVLQDLEEEPVMFGWIVILDVEIMEARLGNSVLQYVAPLQLHHMSVRGGYLKQTMRTRDSHRANQTPKARASHSMPR